MKVATIVGARPQFIKAAMVSRRLRDQAGTAEVLIHTGQHYDPELSDVFFTELELPPPNHVLGIGSASHGEQTGRMLAAIEPILTDEKPDWVLVYGDTNSTLAGALAAAKLMMPVAHVEAGMRSYNKKMPEEINRLLTDHAATLLLASTEGAVENLRRENLKGDKVVLVGDVMYDAALYFGAQAEKRSNVLKAVMVEPKNYLLATIHRAENTDEPRRLRAIVEALTVLAGDIQIVLPLHPRTRSALDKLDLADNLASNVTIIDPIGYFDMQVLEHNASVIITDSGGVQKEAFFHRVPCVTVRTETEWIELVDIGWNRLAASDSNAAIIAAVEAALASEPPQDRADLYGNGRAAEAVAASLAKNI